MASLRINLLHTVESRRYRESDEIWLSFLLVALCTQPFPATNLFLSGTMQSTSIDFSHDRLSPIRSPQLPTSACLDPTTLSAELNAALSMLRNPTITAAASFPPFPVFPFPDPVSFIALTHQLNSFPRFSTSPFITTVASTTPAIHALPISSKTTKDRMPTSPQACSSTVITPSPQQSPQRKQAAPIPNEKKDEAYYERRRKNNDAAKRSRDARRHKEEAIAARAAFLEQENIQLRSQVALLQKETANLHLLLFAQPKSFDKKNLLQNLGNEQGNNLDETNNSYCLDKTTSVFKR